METLYVNLNTYLSMYLQSFRYESAISNRITRNIETNDCFKCLRPSLTAKF